MSASFHEDGDLIGLACTILSNMTASGEGGADQLSIEQVAEDIDRARALRRTLIRRVGGSVTALRRFDPHSDPTEKARDFLENADWFLPVDLAQLGQASRSFPRHVGAHTGTVLDLALNFVSAYASISEYVQMSAVGRWRRKGRPHRKIDVLAGLQHRSMAVTNEVFALLAAGYPDGAEARLRTGVELATTARFLEQSSTDISTRFKDSHHVEMYRRWKDGHLPELTLAVEEIIQKEYARTVRLHGKTITQPYGWAVPAFDKGRVTYGDISRSAALANEASRFANASHHVHAVQTGTRKSLAGDSSDLFGPGPRPGGFLDIAYESVESLHESTTALLRELRRSCGEIEVTYWLELLRYVKGEAQLEIVRAQQMTNPKWAIATMTQLISDMGLDDWFGTQRASSP